MTPRDVITEARNLIQDTEDPLRYSDEFLLNFVNQTVRRISVIRPDLFSFITEIECKPDSVLQECPPDSIRIVEVYNVVGGNGLVEVDKNALDEAYPAWLNEEAAPAVNWARHVRSPNRFFIYPKAPEGQKLNIEYCQVPHPYDMDDAIQHLPDAYFPAVVDGVVFLAESVDDEHVNNNRAQLFQKSFMEALTNSMQARIVTDTDAGGEEPPPDASRMTRTPRNTNYG